MGLIIIQAIHLLQVRSNTEYSLILLLQKYIMMQIKIS